MIPEDWEYVQLSELANIDPESLKTTTDASFEFRYIDIATVSTGKIDKPSKSLKLADAPSRARRVIRSGDVLISTVRPNLKAFAYFNGGRGNFICSTGFSVLRPKENSNGRFLLNALLSNDITGQIDALVVGSNYPAINSSDVKNLVLLAPPVPEQKKIAAILTSVDNVIEKTQAHINKLKSLKKGMMQELLTKGIGHTEFKDSPVGRIPMGWEVISLVEVSTKISDGIHTTPKYTIHSEYCFVNGNNLKEGSVLVGGSTKHVSKDEYIKHKKELGDATILISINGTIGNLAYYRGEMVVLGKSAAYINLKNTVSKDFIYYVLSSEYVKAYYELELTGSTIRNLSIGSIRNTPVAFPCLKEQEEISAILKSIDASIKLSLEKNLKVASLKKALMQDLLTGKVRVKVEQPQ